MTSNRHYRTEHCLPTPSPYPLVSGRWGPLVLRSWADRYALGFIVKNLLPMLRVLHLAAASEGDVSNFSRRLGLKEILPKSIDDAFTEVCIRHEVARAAYARWKTVLFGDNLSITGRVQAEMRRQDTSQRFLEAAFLFWELRRKVAPIAWDLPTPNDFYNAYGKFLDQPEQAFLPPQNQPKVEMSYTLHGAYGREYWLRFASPLGGTAWARGYEPEEGLSRAAPTLIFLQGLGLELDAYRDLEDPTCALARSAGFRVLRLQQPEHGFRKQPGRFGGERILARGPLGMVEAMRQWIHDVAVLIAWARTWSDGPIVIGGLSFGGMTAQLLATVARAWPEELRPSALLLMVTSGDVVDLLHRGSLTRMLQLPRHLRELGWRDQDFLRCSALLQPTGHPVMSPERIVMMLGQSDSLTPFAGGRAQADYWEVPEENRFFLPNKGHFTAPLSLMRDDAPLRRLVEVVS